MARRGNGGRKPRQEQRGRWAAAERAADAKYDGGGNGTVSGQPAQIAYGHTGRPDRVEALYGGQGTPDGEGYSHLVSNDGVNASFLREDGLVHVDDREEDDPYEPHPPRRR